MATLPTFIVCTVYLPVSVYSWVVSSGLSADGTSLRIGEASLEKDIAILRGLTDTCKVERLTAKYLPDFFLAAQDIEILQLCPLKRLDLAQSCFPPSTDVDLSDLTRLEELNLYYCKKHRFCSDRVT